MGPQARLDPLTKILFIRLLSTKVTVLPVPNNALTQSLFNIMVLMGRGEGFGVVKEHKRTVHKLMMVAGRAIEQMSLPLRSFPTRVPHHLLLVLILVRPPLRFALSLFLPIIFSLELCRPLHWVVGAGVPDIHYGNVLTCYSYSILPGTCRKASFF